MMVSIHGDLLKADVDALVNAVNCVGVMGKGIALQFKQAFPENFKAYKKACDAGEVQPGRLFVFDRGGLVENASGPRYIINFPTKRHWRSRSRMADIESGLKALVEEVTARGLTSLAIPPLGSGNGGLNWAEVRPRIEEAFAHLEPVQVHLYEPGSAPSARTLSVRTKRPEMTRAHALFLRLFASYQVYDYDLSLLEAQKLAYFMQVLGEPLKLRYQAGTYGPYADNLNHVLQRMEGHFIRGYGDRAQVRAAIRYDPTAAAEAETLLAQYPDADRIQWRMEQIQTLIDGFQTPYGLELLATVHWLLAQQGASIPDVDTLIQQVGQWNSRKKRLMQPHHIDVALHRLQRCNWTPAPQPEKLLV